MARVAFLAHCLLNQNAKVEGGAKTPAVWAPVLQLLREHGWTIRQMPCPELAFTDFDAVRANFVTALDELLGAHAYVGIATHDEWLIQRGLECVAGLAPEAYGFQMLLGVREERADELVAAGHRLRVYVPFGREWYGYSLRRLQENPKVAGYIAGDTLSRLLGR